MASRTRPVTTVPLDDFLGWAAALSRVDGFVSRRAATDQKTESTADKAWAASLGSFDTDEPPCPVLPADRRLAEDAAAWARGLDPKGDDYLQKLQEAADAGHVTFQTRGTAGSMVHAFQRAMADLALLKRGGAGGWVGTVGDRFDGSVAVDEVRPFDGRRGACWLVKGRETATDLPIAFFLDTPPSAIDLKPGVTVRAAGRVKAHTEFRGRKETTLTRVKLFGE